MSISDFTHWEASIPLTDLGRLAHMCVSKLAIIGSDNGLAPGRRQAIIGTNAGILLIGPLGTNFSEKVIEICAFLFKKMHLKMSSGKWRPFCLGLNVLIWIIFITIVLTRSPHRIPVFHPRWRCRSDNKPSHKLRETLCHSFKDMSWWRHQMETFSALLAICAGNSPVPGEFRAQRQVTRSFDVFFDLRLNKRLRKQSRGLWFETLSCTLWRQCNGHYKPHCLRWVSRKIPWPLQMTFF